MYKIGDIVVHKRDICKITEITKKYKDDEDYYTMVPLDDSSLIIHTPVKSTRGLLRDIIKKSEAKALINRIPEIEILPSDYDDKLLENTYNALINSGEHEGLVQIIKTSYVRKEDRINKGLKASEKDKTYFKLAERLFYSELAVALGKTYQETKDYVFEKVSSATNID